MCRLCDKDPAVVTEEKRRCAWIADELEKAACIYRMQSRGTPDHGPGQGLLIMQHIISALSEDYLPGWKT